MSITKMLKISMFTAITMIAMISCGKGGSDDPENEDGNNKKLVGTWEFVSNYYYFLDNGVFKYTTPTSVAPYLTLYEGKYTTLNGRVYLTNIVNAIYESTKYKDQNLEYSFGTDKDGEYLLIPQYEPLSEEYGGDVSTWEPKKFRRRN
jgi:hypothetical protein